MANRLTDGRWQWPDHLDLLSQKLVDCSEGRCKRLIVTMPPQNGKSSLVAHWFPVWHLNRRPDERVIFISYGAEYAEGWGRNVRNSIVEHRDSLQVRLSGDSKSANEWTTTEGGGMVAVGIGGSVTGRRANVIVFDDPFKNSEEANSATHREKVWQFYLSAAYTRLTPDGVVIVVMTRWHEDDLVGRLKSYEHQTGEQWEHLNLPSIAEPDHGADVLGRKVGEPLWPERWPLETLHRIRAVLGTYLWNGLHQQRPAAPEGNYFKRAWFETIDRNRVPRIKSIVRQWDLAATAQGEGGNTDPDYLAGCLMGVSEHGVYYVLDVYRDRVSANVVETTIQTTASQDGRGCKVRIEQEGAASGKIVKHHFQRMLDGYDCRFTSIPRNSKFVRSGPFNAACERGDVKLVRGAWNSEFIEELTTFPSGKHDDQVDAAAAAFTELSGGAAAWDASTVQKVFSRTSGAKESPGDMLRRKLTGKR